jgi:hypothetical protein
MEENKVLHAIGGSTYTKLKRVRGPEWWSCGGQHPGRAKKRNAQQRAYAEVLTAA